MTRLRTPLQPAPATVLWPFAGAAAGLVSAFSFVPTTGPLSTPGGPTTDLRLVPVPWYLPAAAVMCRSRP